MACPELISVSGDNHAFMGVDPTEIFLAFNPSVYRYSFPDFSYIEDVFAINTFGMDAPWDDPGFMTDGMCVIATPYGFYAIVVSSASSSTRWGIMHVSLDGSSADMIYDSGDINAWTYGALAWHHRYPGTLWAKVHFEDPGAVVANNTEFLYSVDRVSGSITEQMDLKSESGGTIRPSTFGQIQQYAGGLVFATRVASSIADRVHVFDIDSMSFDTITFTNFRGRYTLWTEKAVMLHQAGSENISQVDIDTSGPNVALSSNPTPVCSPLRGYFSIPPDLGSWYSADVEEWYAPADRSAIYVSDTFNVWQMIPVSRIPWLRQRQRDDVNRPAFSRAGNSPRSKQFSIRQGWGGWNNYY